MTLYFLIKNQTLELLFGEISFKCFPHFPPSTIQCSWNYIHYVSLFFNLAYDILFANLISNSFNKVQVYIFWYKGMKIGLILNFIIHNTQIINLCFSVKCLKCLIQKLENVSKHKQFSWILNLNLKVRKLSGIYLNAHTVSLVFHNCTYERSSFVAST